MLIWAGYSEQWALNHKVDFDGENRRIYIAPSVIDLSVKADLYSRWKEWVQLYDNAKYLPAFRSIGGDPIGGGRFAGDIYFMQNGWQIVVDHPIFVSGTLYHDDGIENYIIQAGGAVTSTVSSLVQTVGIEVPANAPTTLQVAQAVRAELEAELARIDAAISSRATIADIAAMA